MRDALKGHSGMGADPPPSSSKPLMRQHVREDLARA